MADYTVTAANVLPPSATAKTLIAGEAITAGMSIYLKASDGLAYKAQHDGTAAEAACIGIAVNSAAAGQVVSYVSSGDIVLGAATFTAAGEIVCVGAGAGGLCIETDVGSSDFLVILGWSISTTTMRFNTSQGIINTGIELA